MKTAIATLCISATALCASSSQANVILHLPMELNADGQLVDEISGAACEATSQFGLEEVNGARQGAIRFDGSSTFVKASSPALSTNVMTISVWCAIETYPMMNVVEAQDVKSILLGNLDATAKNGFNITISSQGHWGFNCYTGGWAVSLDAPNILPTYQWCHIVATIDGTNKKVTLYLNGQQVAQTRCMNSIDVSTGTLWIGKPEQSLTINGGWNINTFNGIIDDIDLYDTALSANEVAALDATATDNDVDMTIPESRFANHLWRPAFHGMPGANWTNETHGLVYYNGLYHLFFQKNANGAYMARLHWGHLTSPDLFNWKEEPIALAPGESYDLKGCWSGCVFTDDAMTAGRPTLFYTAVDNAKARICQASATADDLLTWNKSTQNPCIDGKPSGLSDDFRDPCVFKANDAYYMVVGTSQNNLGATTLHRYNTNTRTWSNDGSIFFKASSKSTSGRFWEMPTVNQIDGQWLFTATPLETAQGVEVQYWVGDIAANGSFTTTQTAPLKVELEGFGQDGYGLLSPSIAQVDGKTIAMGIVPDKLPSSINQQMGWAHNYSLPREWSLNDQHQLVQKPYSGLQAMRTSVSYSASNLSLTGTQALGDVNGRMLEAIGEFKVGNKAFGFRVFEKNGQGMDITFNPSTQMMTVDMTGLARTSNNGGLFNGLYQTGLPRTIVAGETMKIQIFIDHSILDLFINDQWASSIRMFPTDADAIGAQVISEGTTEVQQVNAWVLNKQLGSGLTQVQAENRSASFYKDSTSTLHYERLTPGTIIYVFSVNGLLLHTQKANQSQGTLQFNAAPGIYLIRTSDNQTYKIIL